MRYFRVEYVLDLNTDLYVCMHAGGGDSPCYYWGNALLEKLRIYNGEKKSKSRLEAEKR